MKLFAVKLPLKYVHWQVMPEAIETQYILTLFVMKTKSKALLMTLCAVLLVAASVLGTMAYLTSQDSVKNTFSIGKIAITLDEAQVDADGKAQTNVARVKENSYKLMPGHEYDKDPTVHVTANSENAYIFVKVENGIAAIEADGNKIADQIVTTNGWKQLTDAEGAPVANVYYQEYTKQTAAKDFVVFKSFKVADTVTDTDLAKYEKANITITAYAVQQDGFANAKAAWDAAKFN